MDPTQVYAIVTGGVFGVLLLLKGWPWIAHFIRYLSPLTSKYLVYHYVLRRHRLLGPWSLAGVLVQLSFVTGNVLCLSLGVSQVQTKGSTLSQASLRAGTLSIINLIPLFAGAHLGTLADLLGVNHRTIRQIHRSAGVMAVLLVGFHTMVAFGTRLSFDLQRFPDLFAVIVRLGFLSPTSKLIRGIGSIITGGPHHPFHADFSQAFLRTIHLGTSSFVGAGHLLHMAASALGDDISAPLVIWTSWLVWICVPRPRGCRVLSQRSLPAWPGPSRNHAGLRCH